MTTSDVSRKRGGRERPPVLRRLLGGVFTLVVVGLIIAGAVAVYRYQMRTSPRAQRKKPPRQAKIESEVKDE